MEGAYHRTGLCPLAPWIFAVSNPNAALAAEGCPLEPVGQALEPPKWIVELLEAQYLVLTPFDG